MAASAGAGTSLPGVLSRAFLEQIAGGQPLLLSRRGRLAAVLLDPDSYAELQALVDEALG